MVRCACASWWLFTRNGGWKWDVKSKYGLMFMPYTKWKRIWARLWLFAVMLFNQCLQKWYQIRFRMIDSVRFAVGHSRIKSIFYCTNSLMTFVVVVVFCSLQLMRRSSRSFKVLEHNNTHSWYSNLFFDFWVLHGLMAHIIEETSWNIYVKRKKDARQGKASRGNHVKWNVFGW